MDGISEWCIFIFSLIFFCDYCIVIGGVLLFVSMNRIPSSVNFQVIINTAHLSISSLPPVVRRICSHGWAAWCIFFNAMKILLLFQSFTYCLLSSANRMICLINWIFLSGEFICHPSQCFSITFIIGTLLNTQLFPIWPDPWPCPWSGVVFIGIYVLFGTPRAVWILYFILFSELVCNWHTLSGTPKERLYNVLILQIILS